MFRIRRIFDDLLPVNRAALAAVQGMLGAQIPGLPAREVAELPRRLKRPPRHGYRTFLYVTEDIHRQVSGFALVLHHRELRFLYLEYIVTRPGRTGGGVGGALYERLRRDGRQLDCLGLFFECLPDDPALSPDAATRRQNAARLRFYERLGARPIVGTAYETPVKEGGTDPPYLVFDDLGSGRPLRRGEAKAIVRSILESKYSHLCPPAYIDMVVESFKDDPVRLRAPRYPVTAPVETPEEVPPDRRITVVVNDRHAIHHVHERGYVEAPVRISHILRELETTPFFSRVEPRQHPDRHITELHDPGWVRYFKRVCEGLEGDRAVYPYVFPLRNASRPPRELEVRAGYYCIDTFTPLSKNAYLAARRGVDCALTAAEAVLAGARLAYALVRPPGHHAERRSFGGFCYFNNTAIAAQCLGHEAKVAILDIDYHHGNGQQDIFYERGDVLTVSIHGHPNFAYPYFSGFADERGEGAGRGSNLNLPQHESLDGAGHRKAIERALHAVHSFGAEVLVVALGLDTAKGDPTGSWSLGAADFTANGRLIGAWGGPVLVVQEGGYRVRSLGPNARRFFTGLWEGAFGVRLPSNAAAGHKDRRDSGG